VRGDLRLRHLGQEEVEAFLVGLGALAHGELVNQSLTSVNSRRISRTLTEPSGLKEHHPMRQYAFIWSPYQGKPGEKKFIEIMAGSLKEALDHAYAKQGEWRRQFGDGQVMIAGIESYLGLH
jgi:pullulanase/glycogen debranching enzyme